MSQQYEVKVAVDRPVFELFSYLSSSELAPGVRVEVTFGRQKLMGVVKSSTLYNPDEKRPYKLKSISKVIDEAPVYSEKLLDLAEFLSSYYIHPIGEVLKAMLPGGSKIKREITWTLDKEVDFGTEMFLAEAVKLIFKRKTSLKNATFQKNLKLAAESLSLDSSDLLKTFVAKKIIFSESTSDVKARDASFGTRLGESVQLGEGEKTLTPKQSEAFSKITEDLGKGFTKPVLIHGVTGAGKTELYLQMIKKHLDIDSSSQVLVMVPEISLTPQMTSVFEKRFPGKVAVVHSNLMDTDRWNELEKVRTGSCSILIGPRSSVFAPFKKLAQVIVDEEHDASYKQNTGLMYHGRDAAIFRARLENAGILLGSATPSLETYYNASNGKYVLAELLERVSGRELPKVDVIKIKSTSRKGTLVTGAEDSSSQKSEIFQDNLPICSEVIEALKENKRNGFQSIVLVNRRGYAYYLFNVNSGEALQCPHCSISLTVHKKSTMLHCHYCDYSIGLKEVLNNNPSSKFVSVGYGSEKATDLLKDLIPEANIARVDSDVLQRKDLLPETLNKFRSGEIDILVGTQILAKGHDFAKVTLLCILEVDQLLNLPDLRAGERTFQLMVQASGRAGRGEFPGKVMVQTSKGLNPIVGSALNHDYHRFIEHEISYRKIHGYPPFSRMVQIEFNSEDRNLLMEYSKKIEKWIDQALDDDKSPLSHVKVLGPSAPTIETIRRRHRRTIILVCSDLKTLHQGAKETLSAFGKLKGDIRVKVDVDPQSML